MKKLYALVLSAAIIAPSGVFAAGGNHPMAGCGLGYVLFGHNDNSQISQIFAATTNDTFGTQTFGISSGTSGCTEDGAVKFVKATEVYAEVNLDSLRREMAVGKGEFVETFAGMIGSEPAQRASLVKLFQSQYAVLFPSSSTSSAELMSHLQTLLNQHPEFVG